MNIDVDNETAAKLDSIAKKRNTSVSDLLRGYADQQVTFLEEKKEDEQAWQAAARGEFIDNGKVMEWLESWGSDKELPCPALK